MTEQEINLEKQRQAAINREKELRNKKNKPEMTSFENNNYAPVNNNKSPTKQSPEIKAPMNVQDILNRLHKYFIIINAIIIFIIIKKIAVKP